MGHLHKMQWLLSCSFPRRDASLKIIYLEEGTKNSTEHLQEICLAMIDPCLNSRETFLKILTSSQAVETHLIRMSPILGTRTICLPQWQPISIETISSEPCSNTIEDK